MKNSTYIQIAEDIVQIAELWGCLLNMSMETKMIQQILRKNSSFTLFDWKTHCFICGYSIIVDPKNPTRHSAYMVRTLEMKNSDYSAHEVEVRISSCVVHSLLPLKRAIIKYATHFSPRTVSSGTTGSVAHGRPVDDQTTYHVRAKCR